MSGPGQTEIKFRASPAMLARLKNEARLGGAERVATLVTTCFDTANAKLHRGGAGLRVRTDGTRREQILKLGAFDATPVRQHEWRIELSSDNLQPALFPAPARASLAKLLDGAFVEAVGTTRVDCTTRRIKVGGSAIGIAFIDGSIRAAGSEESLSELELELVEGKLSDLVAVALDLPVGPELAWSVRGEGERCYDLAFDLAPTAARAARIRLSPDLSVAKGFQTIAWSCLEQLLANYLLVIDTGDAEAIHQSRVAIRRLRAAFSLFGEVVSDDVAPILRAAFKAAADGLGAARDLHVQLAFLERVESRNAEDLIRLRAHLKARRAAAVGSAQALLATAQFQRLLLETAGWIEAGGWIALGGELGRSQLAPFAAATLSRRRRKLRKAQGRLAEMSDAKRHRLRIRIKKLRYAAEFFSLQGATDPAESRRTFLKALSQLQDGLGELNDQAVAAAGHRAWFAELAPIEAARLEAQLGELVDARARSRRALMRKAERSLDTIASAPAWWKRD